MLTIVIVNYKSLDLINDCLSSLYKHSDNLRMEIIIIDNAEDNPSDLLTSFPDIQWISMGYNAGFARANNKGISLTQGSVLLLLNPDIIIEDNSIITCYERLLASNYIAAGVQLQNEDHSPQISGSYFMKGGLNHFLPIPYLGSFFKYIGTKMKVRKTSIKEANEEVEVDWINGAFLMVKREALSTSGLLDEDFFLYAEEIEWCSRLRKVGKLCIYGDLHVVHLQGEASNEAFDSEGKGYYNLFDKKGRQLMLSNFVRIRKQFGVDWFFIHLLMYLAGIPVFLFGLLFSNRNYSFRQFTGYSRNVLYVVGKSLHIALNKPYFYKAI